MALKQLKPVVVQAVKAGLFVLALLNLIFGFCGLPKLNVSVEPRHLKLTNLVLGLKHTVRNTLRRLDG